MTAATNRDRSGRVESVLPRGLFAVRTSDGTVVAGVGREAIHVVRVKPGDRVVVRVSPRDPTRGRIVGLTDARTGGGS